MKQVPVVGEEKEIVGGTQESAFTAVLWRAGNCTYLQFPEVGDLPRGDYRRRTSHGWDVRSHKRPALLHREVFLPGAKREQDHRICRKHVSMDAVATALREALEDLEGDEDDGLPEPLHEGCEVWPLESNNEWLVATKPDDNRHVRIYMLPTFARWTGVYGYDNGDETCWSPWPRMRRDDAGWLWAPQNQKGELVTPDYVEMRRSENG